ncbi:MAG: hypothetical protein ACKO23_10145 [Gemmataceae bacterium]
MSNELNVLALIKGDERYIYVYDEASRAKLIEAFHHHAADCQLSLNWFDAVVLAKKAAEQDTLQIQPIGGKSNRF